MLTQDSSERVSDNSVPWHRFDANRSVWGFVTALLFIAPLMTGCSDSDPHPEDDPSIPVADDDDDEDLVATRLGALDGVGAEFLTATELGVADATEEVSLSPGAASPGGQQAARRLLAAVDLLRTAPEETGSASILSDAEVNETIKRAEVLIRRSKIKSPNAEVTAAADVDRAFVVETSREAVKESARTIRELDATAAKLRVGSHNASIRRIVEAEAKFRVLHSGLSSAIGSGLPSDPLALADAETLQKARTSLQTQRRLMQDHDVLLSTADSRGRVELFDQWIKRIDSIVESGEAAEFRKSAPDSLKNINNSDWRQVFTDLDAKVDSEVERIVRNEIEPRTSWKEVVIGSRTTRGPPKTRLAQQLDVALFDCVIDPAEWCRAEARIQSLGDKLAAFEEIPRALRTKPGKSLERVLVLADDAYLEMGKRVSSSILSADSGSAESKLFPERLNHFQRFRDACESEIKRREAGGAKIQVPEQSPLSSLVDSYMAEAMPRRAEARLFSVVSGRYSNANTIPTALRDELKRITQTSANEYADRISKHVDSYLEMSDKLARSTGQISEPVRSHYKKYREQLAVLSNEMANHLAAAERTGADIASARQKMDRLKAILPRPPPDFEPPPPKAPSPQPGLDGGGSGALRVSDADLSRLAESPGAPLTTRSNPALEKQLYYIEAHLNQTQAELNAIKEVERVSPPNTKPLQYASRNGRRTLNEADIAGGAEPFDWKSLAPDASKTRLPESLHEWKGRIQSDGTAFDFQSQVKRPRSFKALGGGIHFGEIAQPEGDTDLSDFTLRYDAELGLHLSNGISGSVIIIDSEIEPTALKALYRFAADGRNAAVSIGWGLERQSLDVLLTRAVEGSPVLLDPYLVDTPVGQTLILADSIPWDFGEATLPNGKLLPDSLSKEFAPEVKAYRERQVVALKQVVADVQPFAESSRRTWFEKLKNADVPLLLRAQLFSNSEDEAIEWYIDESFRTGLQDNGHSVGKDAEDSFRKFIRSQSERALLGEGVVLSQLGAEQRQAFDRLVEERVDEVRTAIRNEYEEGIELFSDGDSSPLLQLTDLAMMSSFVTESECPSVLIELWVATFLSEKDDNDVDSLASSLLARINPTTLAYLYDDSVTFRAADDRLLLTVTPRYRYATSFIRVDDDVVGIGRKDDPDNEVQVLTQLTDLANEHMDYLQSNFEPLSATIRYAGVAAFLKWAISAKDNGGLVAIDLSDLADYPAHNEEQFPTADAIRKQ